MASTPLSFDPWTSDDVESFFSKYQDWEDAVFAQYRKHNRADKYFDSITKHRLNLKPILDAIPKNEREALLAEYKNLIQFPLTLDKRGLEDSEWIKGVGDPRPFGRYHVDPDQLSEGHPLSVIYNRMTVQFSHSKRMAGKNPYDIGSNILRGDFLRQMTEEARSPSTLKAGAKVLVFDTETAGLAEDAGIRQISARLLTVADDGRINFTRPLSVYDEHFKTARMGIGFLRDSKGNTRPMNEAIQDLFDIPHFANAETGSGKEFVEALEPFLRQIEDADVLVGHNIAFDIDQIVRGLSHTGYYRDNIDGFQDRLNQIRATISSKTVRKVDTLEMARTQLPHLQPAIEMGLSDRASSHSLENLMLQTNLSELLQRDLGTDEFLKLIGAGDEKGMMHASSTDTLIEAHLYDYLRAGVLEERSREELTRTAVGRSVRRAVLASYAPTPISHIANIRHLDPELFAEMFKEEDSIRAMVGNGVELGPENWLNPDAMYKDLLEQDNIAYSLKVNPIEQEIWKTRRTLHTEEKTTSDALVYGLGKWRKFAGIDSTNEGWLNKISTLFKRGSRPGSTEWEAFQDSMRASGMPFAGLAPEERWLTGAIAAASGQNSTMFRGLSPLDRNIISIGDDVGVSYFGKIASAYISPSRQNISLPIELLKAAEAKGVLSSNLRGIGDSVEMLSLSTFETAGGRANANLVYNFAGKTTKDRAAQATALADWLKSVDLDEALDESGSTLRDFGFSKYKLQKIVAGLPDIGAQNGIGVARLDSTAAAHIREAVSSLHQGIIADNATLNMVAGILDDTGDTIKVGGFMLNRWLSESAKANYHRDLGIARTRLGQLGEIASDSRKLATTKLAIATGKGEVVEKIVNAMDSVSPRIPLIAGAATLGSIAYYMFHKKKENDFYDQTMEAQPIQSGADYKRYRDEMGMPYAPARRMDVLATAGVVGNLDRNKIGHTAMGPQKYNGLFGGV